MSLLITFEGVEGCGKTTQSQLLEQFLKENDHSVVREKEPGGVKFSEEIRRLLLDPKYKGQVGPRTEVFLYEGARAQFFDDFVLPNLEQGTIVLLDRCYDSTTAYQGYGRGLSKSLISMCNMAAVSARKPDLTFLFDRDAKAGLEGATTDEFGEADRIESEPVEFHEKVRYGFLEIAKKEPNRVKVIQYIHGNIERMHEEVRNYIAPLLNK